MHHTIACHHPGPGPHIGHLLEFRFRVNFIENLIILTDRAGELQVTGSMGRHTNLYGARPLGDHPVQSHLEHLVSLDWPVGQTNTEVEIILGVRTVSCQAGVDDGGVGAAVRVKQKTAPVVRQPAAHQELKQITFEFGA